MKIQGSIEATSGTIQTTLTVNSLAVSNSITVTSIVAATTISAAAYFKGPYTIPEITGLISGEPTGFPTSQMANVTVTINAVSGTATVTLSPITGGSYSYSYTRFMENVITHSSIEYY